MATGQDLTAADLFCGAGGLTEGFKAAGYDVVFALDRDPDSCATYRRNHPATKLEERALGDTSYLSTAKSIGPVDVIIGGPSCQGFSTHGRRHNWVVPGDERNKLWREMRYVVKSVRPKAFLLENVPGLVYYKDGHIGGQIIDLFTRLGYDVRTQILLAANYGVPQLRRRVFVVGTLPEFSFEFPAETHLGSWRRDTIRQWEEERLRRGLLPHVSCWDAIGDLHRVAVGDGEPVPYATGPTSAYTDQMRAGSGAVTHHGARELAKAHFDLVQHIPPGGTWRDIPQHLLPDRFRGGMRRTDSTNLFGRLDPDRPAYTITTQFNNVTCGCFTHPLQHRALTYREAARLQSFPDRYEFVGGVGSLCRQIGNAVPPMLAEQLAHAITDAIRHPKRVVRTRQLVTLTPPTRGTRERMQSQARKNTKAEILIRKELFARGHRYQIHRKVEPTLRREVDIYLPKWRLAVFVDGCFWHGCPVHTRPTKSNTKWWADKIARNRARDDETTKLLVDHGHRVVRVWEHEHPKDAADRIAAVIDTLRP